MLDALSQYPRPHQLCWSDQGIGTAAITSTKYSQVAAGLIQKVSGGTLKASSLHAAVLRAVVLRSKIIAIVNVMCYQCANVNACMATHIQKGWRCLFIVMAVSAAEMKIFWWFLFQLKLCQCSVMLCINKSTAKRSVNKVMYVHMYVP